MLRRVMKYIRDKQLLSTSAKVLVALSGGADSVALLDVLIRGGYPCVAAHCNFQLRGEESMRDEQFVKELCAKRGVKLCNISFDTHLCAERQKKSIELTARNLRYSWFDTMAKQEGCEAVAVAHHQNDQAETILMNLRRGAGIRGLCGMRAKSNNPCVDSTVSIVRPLLCTTHDYIIHYLRDIRKMEWVEDSTNQDTSFRRNQIRAELATYPKAEIEHMAQTAEIMQGYLDWIEQLDTPEAKEAQAYEALRTRR